MEWSECEDDESGTSSQLPEQIKLVLCRVSGNGDLYLLDPVICVNRKHMHDQIHSLNIHLNKRKENFYYFVAMDPESRVPLEVEWSIDNFETSHTGVFRLFSRNTSKHHIINRIKSPLPEVSSSEKNSIILKVLDTTATGGANGIEDHVDNVEDPMFLMLSSKRMRMTIPQESKDNYYCPKHYCALYTWNSPLFTCNHDSSLESGTTFSDSIDHSLPIYPIASPLYSSINMHVPYDEQQVQKEDDHTGTCRPLLDIDEGSLNGNVNKDSNEEWEPKPPNLNENSNQNMPINDDLLNLYILDM